MHQSKRRGVRITNVGTDGKQTYTAQELQQREILRRAREVVSLERKQRDLKKRLKEVGKKLKAARLAQKVVLRHSLQVEEFESA